MCGLLLSATVRASADTTPPVVIINNPDAGGIYTSSPVARGTASDSESGVNQVGVELARYDSSSQLYGWWNWTTNAWEPASASTSSQIIKIATGTTSWSAALPALPVLPSGHFYAVWATANDKAVPPNQANPWVYRTFTIVPGYKISGRVRNSAGTGGVGNVKVRRYASTDTNFTTPLQTFTTGAQGYYTLIGVAPGSYKIRATRVGYRFTGPLSVTVNNAPIPNMNLRSIGISGRILDSAGTSGVAGIVVKRYAATDTSYATPLQSVTSNATGYYSFDGLAAGTYLIKPFTTGYTYTPVYRNVTLGNLNITLRNFNSAPTSTPSITGVSLRSFPLMKSEGGLSLIRSRSTSGRTGRNAVRVAVR